MRKPPSARSNNLPALVAKIDGGPAILIIGDVVAHSAPWRQPNLDHRDLELWKLPNDLSARTEENQDHRPSVVTANRTWDGAVVYRTARQGWSADLSDAAIVRTADEARALLAEAVADDVGAVGPYIAPVEVDDDGKIVPGNLREQIRREV